MRKRRTCQTGMSMLEVVVTVFLVTLGLLVVMTSFIAIAKANRHAERMDVATSLARFELEQIRNLQFANIQSETGTYSEYPNHPDFRHVTTVTNFGNVKEVVLHVYFEGDRRRAEVRTFIANM